jgi:hypothetical protein
MLEVRIEKSPRAAGPDQNPKCTEQDQVVAEQKQILQGQDHRMVELFHRSSIMRDLRASSK